jgi:hypothetical protein
MYVNMNTRKTKITMGVAETLSDARATARAAKEYLRVKCMAGEKLDRLEVS